MGGGGGGGGEEEEIVIKEHYNKRDRILTNYIDSDIITSSSLQDIDSSSDCPSTCVCAIILVS